LQKLLNDKDIKKTYLKGKNCKILAGPLRQDSPAVYCTVYSTVYAALHYSTLMEIFAVMQLNVPCEVTLKGNEICG
jgi:hypothetical protein